MTTSRVITDDERRARLARRHRLAAAVRTDDVATIVDDVVALHSSDPATVYLSALVRMTDPDVSAIDDALYEARTIVRHHAMRRTMWVMTPGTARRAHAATTEKIAVAERRRTLVALAGSGIDDPASWLERAVAEIVDLLAGDGAMTTREVGSALPHLVVPIVFGAGTKNRAAINAHTKVLQGAGFEGLVVRTRPTGSWTSSEYAWMATEAWLGSSIVGRDRASAAAELLDHWLQRFGPATDDDIRWWFGWTVAVARQALADADAAVVGLDGGGLAWVAAADVDSVGPVEPWVRLLPGLDVTTMGWRHRDWYLDPSMVTRLFDRFGNAGPTIWADGRVVGGWAQRVDGEIVLDVLAPLDDACTRLLADATEELAAVLGDAVVRPRFPSPNQRELVG